MTSWQSLTISCYCINMFNCTNTTTKPVLRLVFKDRQIKFSISKSKKWNAIRQTLWESSIFCKSLISCSLLLPVAIRYILMVDEDCIWHRSQFFGHACTNQISANISSADIFSEIIQNSPFLQGWICPPIAVTNLSQVKFESHC